MKTSRESFSGAAQSLQFIGIVNVKFYANWLLRTFDMDGRLSAGTVRPASHGTVLLRPQSFNPARQAAFFGTIDAALKARSGLGLRAILFPTGTREDGAEPYATCFEEIRIRCPALPLVEVSTGRLPADLNFDYTFVPASVGTRPATARPVILYDKEREIVASLADKYGMKHPFPDSRKADLEPIRKIIATLRDGSSPAIAVPAAVKR